MAKKGISKRGVSSRLEIRLPLETKQKLLDMCGDQFTASEMLRQIIECGEVPDLTVGSDIREKKKLIEPVIIELSRVGNNLNQVAKACNAVLRFFNHHKDNEKLDQDTLKEITLQRLKEEMTSLTDVRKSLNDLMSDLIKWSNQNAG